MDLTIFKATIFALLGQYICEFDGLSQDTSRRMCPLPVLAGTAEGWAMQKQEGSPRLRQLEIRF